MTRYRVAVEGKLDGDKYIMPGAITWREGSVPVTVNFDPHNVIGSASKIERDEETGDISCEIEIIDEKWAEADRFGWKLFNAESGVMDGLGIIIKDSHAASRPIHKIISGMLGEISYLGMTVGDPSTPTIVINEDDNGPDQA